MSTSSVIGPSITIKGDVTANEPLTIAGRVDGTVTLTGHPLTIDERGHVKATVHGDTIIIGGHVKGSVTATVRLDLQETAVVDGTVSAPLMTVADGAHLGGKVEVAGRKGEAALKMAS